MRLDVFSVSAWDLVQPQTETNQHLDQWLFWTIQFERIKDIVTPQDVIIVFSLGGKSKDVNNSILQAKRHGATVLTITTLDNHLLSKISDHMIFVYDAPKKRENLRSRLMFNLVGNLLFEVILTEQQRRSSR